MATIQLPPDFREFLKSLNSSNIQYLLIGGYAVNYYGFARATADLDIWVATDQDNAEKVTRALHEFGFPQAEVEMLLKPGTIIRLGVPPIRIAILTSISDAEFANCFSRRLAAEMDGTPINLIHLDDLKRNKRAAGWLKDRLDLEELG